MKIRNGFVSNSSTSSFICSVCAEKYEGWEASPYDYGGVYCENEHAICGSCWGEVSKEGATVKEKGCEHNFDREAMKFCSECGEPAYIETALDDFDYEVPAKFCPVCQFKTYDNEEMANYLEKTRNINREEVFAKIKEKNRRRRKLYDKEYVSYVLEQCNLTDDDVLEEIKVRFETFDKYSKFLFERA